MANFTDQPPEVRKIYIDLVNQRWGQLHALEKEWFERAIQYLFLLNSGGAIATLSFLGASKIPFASATGVKVSLGSFILGIVLVGLSVAKSYYRMAGLFRHYRKNVNLYFKDQISWEYLTDKDEKRSEARWLDHLLPWLSFGCFIIGCGLGSFSLFY